jgi:choline dehydrogenase-like flavoprotein
MTVTRSFPHSVDVAIVGSGPTGAAYARILSERNPNATIAMFEVGPALTDPPGMHVKNIADPVARAQAQRSSEGPRPHTPVDGHTDEGSYASPDKRVVRPGTFLLSDGFQQPGEDGLPGVAMSSNVGGMGAHWTAACPRPGDAEMIDFLPELDGWLDEAERLLHVLRHPFDEAPYSDVVRERLSGVFDQDRRDERRVRAMPLAVRRLDDGTLAWTGPDVVFGDQTRSNPNFTLYPEAQASRVLVEDGRAVGLRIRDRRDGAVHEVRARYVVVAADALRTPQLLWASGVRPRALGRYLNDQPQVVFAVRLRDIAPTAEAADVARGDSVIVEQSGVTWVPYTDAEPFHGQVMQLDASPIALVDEDEPVPGSIVGLGWFCGKDLQEWDRVEFDDTARDTYDMPAMRIHYVLTDRDRRALDDAKAAIVRAGEALGEPLDDKPIELTPGASLHYQGTTRMGAQDDGTSVCGPTSEVWGVSGLYVAGNNVIPTSIACNPTLTSVALAIGGASDISRRLAEEGRR